MSAVITLVLPDDLAPEDEVTVREVGSALAELGVVPELTVTVPRRVGGPVLVCAAERRSEQELRALAGGSILWCGLFGHDARLPEGAGSGHVVWEARAHHAAALVASGALVVPAPVLPAPVALSGPARSGAGSPWTAALRQALLATAAAQASVPPPGPASPPAGALEPALLTVAMIVKDESAVLGRALASLSPLRGALGQTCLYDTGSRDDTVALGLRQGARVRLGQWREDFAWARNRSLEMVGSGWVLQLDADEEVVVDRAALTALLARAGDELAFNVCQRNLTADGGQAPDSWQTRLVRAEHVEYRGRIHEQAVPRAGGRLTCARIPADVLHLRHDGYAHIGPVDEKAQRNARIAEAGMAGFQPDGAGAQEREEHYRLQLHRARSLLDTEQWQAGIADLTQIINEAPSGPSRTAALEGLAETLLATGHLDVAEHLLDELDGPAAADLDSPANPGFAAWLRARLLMARDELAGAHAVLDGVQSPPFPTMSWGVHPADFFTVKATLAAAVGAAQEELAARVAAVAAGARSEPDLEALLLAWGRRPLQPLLDLMRQACRDAGTDHSVVPALGSLSARLRATRTPAPTRRIG